MKKLFALLFVAGLGISTLGCTETPPPAAKPAETTPAAEAPVTPTDPAAEPPAPVTPPAESTPAPEAPAATTEGDKAPE